MRVTTRIAASGAIVLFLITTSTRAGGILFLTGATPMSAPDQAIYNHLTTDLGYAVTQMDGHVATSSDFAGDQLLITSASLGSSVVLNRWNSAGWVTSGGDGALYRNLPYPILNMQNGLSKNLGMTVTGNAGQGTGTNSGSSYPNPGNDINILDPASPLAAGLSAGFQPVFTSTPAGVSVFGNTNFSVLGNQVQPGVDIVASITTPVFGNIAIDSAYAGIESMEKGNPLGFVNFATYSTTATSRRVQFPIDANSFTNLNANGLKLFDAAVAYAYAGPVPEPSTFVLAGMGLAGLLALRLRKKHAS